MCYKAGFNLVKKKYVNLELLQYKKKRIRIQLSKHYIV